MAGSEGLADDVVLGIAEAVFVEAQPPGQLLKDAEVRPGLAGRRQRRARHLQIVVPVGQVEIGVLEKRRGRQDDVGVVGRVGGELFDHHGEEILPAQAFDHELLARGRGRWIGVVDHQRFHRRGVQLRQGAAQPHHVDAARRAPQTGALDEIRAGEGIEIQLEAAGGGQQHAAAQVPPGAGKNREQRHGAHRRRSAFAPLEAVVQPDGGGPRGGVLHCQLHDLAGRDSGEFGGALRRVALGKGAEVVEPLHVGLDVVGVMQVLAQDDVDHAQRQGEVRAWVDEVVAVGGLTGAVANGIDGVETSPVAPGLDDERP